MLCNFLHFPSVGGWCSRGLVPFGVPWCCEVNETKAHVSVSALAGALFCGYFSLPERIEILSKFCHQNFLSSVRSGNVPLFLRSDMAFHYSTTRSTMKGGLNKSMEMQCVTPAVSVTAQTALEDSLSPQ